MPFMPFSENDNIKTISGVNKVLKKEITITNKLTQRKTLYHNTIKTFNHIDLKKLCCNNS